MQPSCVKVAFLHDARGRQPSRGELGGDARDGVCRELAGGDAHPDGAAAVHAQQGRQLGSSGDVRQLVRPVQALHDALGPRGSDEREGVGHPGGEQFRPVVGGARLVLVREEALLPDDDAQALVELLDEGVRAARTDPGDDVRRPAR